MNDEKKDALARKLAEDLYQNLLKNFESLKTCEMPANVAFDVIERSMSISGAKWRYARMTGRVK